MRADLDVGMGWSGGFVATVIALGGTVDEALEALPEATPEPALAIANRLRSPQRAVRAAALASAVHEILIAIDEATLR